MRIIKFLAVIIIAMLLFSSCRKIEKLSTIPHIAFTRFTVFDTTTILGEYKAGRLVFHFEDGDGDVGLDAPTGYQIDTTDLFLGLFRKKGGIMDTITDKNDPLLPYSSYRIPYMERTGVNKILKGYISVTFLYLSYSHGDTIKYDFYIKDRALNESNIESTREIVVSYDSTYKK
jgi:hypothetical protein